MVLLTGHSLLVAAPCGHLFLLERYCPSSKHVRTTFLEFHPHLALPAMEDCPTG